MSGKSVTFYFKKEIQQLYNFQDKCKQEGIKHYSNVITQLIEDYAEGNLPKDYFKKINDKLKERQL
jgi:hypothetical protein